MERTNREMQNDMNLAVMKALKEKEHSEIAASSGHIEEASLADIERDYRVHSLERIKGNRQDRRKAQRLKKRMKKRGY